MPDASLTPEQQQAQIELDTILRSDNYTKGDSWTSQAAAERAVELRRIILADRNQVLLHVGPQPDPELPDALDPAKLPVRPDGWSRGKLWSLASAASEFQIDPAEVRSRLLAAQATEPPSTEDAEKQLRAEWGDAFAAKLAAAQLVYARLDPVLQVELEETGMGNDPATIRLFAERGGPLLHAQQQLDKILNDRSHAYWTGDEAAVQEVLRLNRMIHGTREVARIG